MRPQRSLPAIIALFTLSLLTTPLATQAQQAAKVYRIGFMSMGITTFEAFAAGLRELGYIDYKHFEIDRRDVSDATLLPAIAAELVGKKPDVIVAVSEQAALATKSITKTIPIVAIAGDPVGMGLVASLASPGGSITGLSTIAPEIAGKRLELLKEAMPKLSRVAVLWSPGHTAQTVGLKEMQLASQAMGLKLSSLGARSTTEYGDALATAIRKRADALVMIGGDPFGGPPSAQILRLVARRRLPAMYDRKDYVNAGGLMAFGANLPHIYRRAAIYVDKILKGTKPADLPVEQPTKFELVINLKTAKALGLTIPQSVLIRADEVIQ